MKKSLYVLSILAVGALYSCSQGSEKKAETGATKLDSANMQCFDAADGVDSASLKLITDKDGKVTGSLLINYLEKGDSHGEILGKFNGDTLFVDYSFQIGATNTTFYKNPLAFLKKDGKLFMGVGQIETFLGKSSFVDNKRISFDRGRFVFSTADCK
ncbi:MAG: hypothetical protein EOO89_02455 [Pedobacter sp.]|nr:MAG: hypothetical protein EOO89_02455 [Pedobacter sp.]